jgi:hypothetical protein
MRHTLIFLGILISTTLLAQTRGWKQVPGPYRGTVVQVETTPNGIVYALNFENSTAYTYQLLYRDTDKQWYKSPLPANFANNNGSSSGVISVAADGTIFYFNASAANFTDPTGIYRSADKGRTWTHALAISYISAICESKSGTLYGFQGMNSVGPTVIFRSVDQGVTWDTLSSIPLTSFDFLVDGNDRCYFSTFENKLSVVQYDPKTNLYKAFTSDFESASIAFISICNGNVVARTTSGFYLLKPDGTWQKQSGLGIYIAPSLFSYIYPQYISSLVSSPDGLLYTSVPEVNTNGYKVISSSDLGKNWQDVTLPIGSPTYSSLAFDSIGNKYLCSLYTTDGPGVLSSSTKGDSWKPCGIPLTNFQSLQNAPNHSIYALEYETLPGATYVQPKAGYLSSDQGKTWDNSNLILQGLPDNTGFFGKGWDGSFYYFDYHFDQSTYTAKSSIYFANTANPTSFDLSTSSVYSGSMPATTAATASKFYALYGSYDREANSALLSTADHGISWDAVTTPLTGTSIWTFNIDPQSRMYVGYSPGLYRSTDSGASWSKFITPIKNASISVITFAPSGSIIVGTQGDGLWHSTNDGSTWQKWAPAEFDSISGVETIGTMCYAATSKGIISCPLTSSSWNNELLVNERSPILQLLKSDSGYLYASVANFGIWTTNPNIPVFRTIRTASEGFSLKINESLDHSQSVTFTLKNYEHITLSLYDILGHKVQTISDGDFDSGQHRIPLPTSQMANGMYNVILTTDNVRAPAKLLINR